MYGVVDTKVYVERDFSKFDSIDIYIVRQLHTGVTEVGWIGDSGTLEFISHEPNTKPNPTISLPVYIIKLLLGSFSEKGLASDNSSKIEGTLVATQAHLEDMRRIAYAAIFADESADVKDKLAQAVLATLSLKQQ